MAGTAFPVADCVKSASSTVWRHQACVFIHSLRVNPILATVNKAGPNGNKLKDVCESKFSFLPIYLEVRPWVIHVCTFDCIKEIAGVFQKDLLLPFHSMNAALPAPGWMDSLN